MKMPTNELRKPTNRRLPNYYKKRQLNTIETKKVTGAATRPRTCLARSDKLRGQQAETGRSTVVEASQTSNNEEVTSEP